MKSTTFRIVLAESPCFWFDKDVVRVTLQISLNVRTLSPRDRDTVARVRASIIPGTHVTQATQNPWCSFWPHLRTQLPRYQALFLQPSVVSL